MPGSQEFVLTKIKTEHSLNLPGVHLEQQYEQKRKKCHRPHLQQTGLDWMSILEPNQEIKQHKIITTPGKTRKKFCLKLPEIYFKHIPNNFLTKY